MKTKEELGIIIAEQTFTSVLIMLVLWWFGDFDIAKYYWFLFWLIPVMVIGTIALQPLEKWLAKMFGKLFSSKKKR